MPRAAEALPFADAPAPEIRDTEIAGYELLTESVRDMRALLVAQRHGDARASADGLLEMALQLEQQTRERNATRDVKPDSAPADESARHATAPADAASLLSAQERARQELSVTLQVLADLRGHTETLLASLLGHGRRGYDRMGRATR